eukprot:tig00000912_g5441.t1
MGERRVARPPWDLSAHNFRLPEYNSLQDQNLRSYFGNRRVQQILHKHGLIDRDGRVLDVEKAKSKIFIIEQEFKNAEKAEQLRIKEEEELRRRIQIKRHEALEDTRRAERLARMKEEARQRREIIQSMSMFRYGLEHSKFRTEAPPAAKRVGEHEPARGSGSGAEEGQALGTEEDILEALLREGFDRARVGGDEDEEDLEARYGKDYAGLGDFLVKTEKE